MFCREFTADGWLWVLLWWRRRIVFTTCTLTTTSGVFYLASVSIARMPDETDAKQILTASPAGNWRRPLGRPRITWMKTIQQDLKSLVWTTQLTWRRTVHSGDWCLRSALRTLSGACQKWRWWISISCTIFHVLNGMLSCGMLLWSIVIPHVDIIVLKLHSWYLAINFLQNMH